MAHLTGTSAASCRAGGHVMDFQRRFTRPFLIRATDRAGLVLGALAETAQADPALADHLLHALVTAEDADPFRFAQPPLRDVNNSFNPDRLVLQDR